MISGGRTSARAGVALLLAGLAFQASAVTHLDPDDLAVPQTITCVDFTEPVVFSRTGNLFHFAATIRFERGPWISEHEDARGTYYRAPPGGIDVAMTDSSDSAPNRTFDGGVWIPHDAKLAPHYYIYDVVQTVPPIVPRADANCASVGYARDPATRRVSIVAGPTLAQGWLSDPGPEQSVTDLPLPPVPLAILLIKLDIGKIIPESLPRNADLVAKLRAIAASPIELREVPATPAPASASASASAASISN